MSRELKKKFCRSFEVNLIVPEGYDLSKGDLICILPNIEKKSATPNIVHARSLDELDVIPLWMIPRC